MPVYLFATFAAIACGPVLYAVAGGRPRVHRVLAVLVWGGLLTLLAFEVMPEAVEAGGWRGLIWFALGLAGPGVLEHAVRRLRRQTHLAALGIAVIGLALHALGDGAVLAATGPGASTLGAAVALHSLPIGLAVCWLLIPLIGWRRSTLVIVGIGAATLVGFHLTPNLKLALGSIGWGWMQMAVAGLLVHAMFGRPHLHQHRLAMAEERADAALYLRLARQLDPGGARECPAADGGLEHE